MSAQNQAEKSRAFFFYKKIGIENVLERESSLR